MLLQSGARVSDLPGLLLGDAGELGLLARVLRVFGDSPAVAHEVERDAVLGLALVESDLNSAGAQASAFQFVLVNRRGDHVLGPGDLLQLAGIHVLRQALHGQVNDLRLLLHRVVVLERGLASRRAVAGKHRLLRRLGLASRNGVRRGPRAFFFGHFDGRVCVEDRSEGLGHHGLGVVVLLDGLVGVLAGLEVLRGFAPFRHVFVFVPVIVHVNPSLLHRHVPCIVRLLQHA